MSSAAVAAGAAVAGLGAGALLPRLLARLPVALPSEPVAPPSEPASPPSEPALTEEPTAPDGPDAGTGAGRSWTYPGLARTPGLALRLGVATALVWGLLGAARGWSADLPAFLAIGAVGVLLGWVDLRVRRLPDALTLPSYAVGGVLLGVAALADGNPGRWAGSWLGALALFAAYLLLVVIHPAGMGFGDVKLAGVLGLYLSWLGWGHLAVGAFLGFVVGAFVGVFVILAGRGTRTSMVPFGPSMLVGALLAVLWGQPVLDAYWGR